MVQIHLLGCFFGSNFPLPDIIIFQKRRYMTQDTSLPLQNNSSCFCNHLEAHHITARRAFYVRHDFFQFIFELQVNTYTFQRYRVSNWVYPLIRCNPAQPMAKLEPGPEGPDPKWISQKYRPWESNPGSVAFTPHPQ